VQTRVPDHEVLLGVRNGDPGPVLERERDRRREHGFPPFGGLAELSGDPAAVAAACDTLRSKVRVLGPTAGRALLRADTVDVLCDALAAVDLAPARALGRLRVDVDPLRV
jgi:primosomal protein N'